VKKKNPIAQTSIIAIICISFIFHFNCQAQSNDSTSVDTEGVVAVVDQQPTFPGGNRKMAKFINKNLRYPESARRTGAMGRVFTGFIVAKDGSISDIRTVRGVSPDLDAEARRIIALMPKWMPGKQDGEIVHCRYIIPINFHLTEPKKRKKN
jgi:periplasmic protein TonB